MDPNCKYTKQVVVRGDSGFFSSADFLNFSFRIMHGEIRYRNYEEKYMIDLGFGMGRDCNIANIFNGCMGKLYVNDAEDLRYERSPYREVCMSEEDNIVFKRWIMKQYQENLQTAEYYPYSIMSNEMCFAWAHFAMNLSVNSTDFYFRNFANKIYNGGDFKLYELPLNHLFGKKYNEALHFDLLHNRDRLPFYPIKKHPWLFDPLFQRVDFNVFITSEYGVSKELRQAQELYNFGNSVTNNKSTTNNQELDNFSLYEKIKKERDYSTKYFLGEALFKEGQSKEEQEQEIIRILNNLSGFER